jgi:hypothetical protein
MPYLVHVPDGAPWIVAELWGFADSVDVVGSRRDMASLNAENRYNLFIFDFSAVEELDLTLEARDGVVEIDRERTVFIPDGKCAFVVPRESVLIGLEMLARSSRMAVEFRSFGTRSGAEAWLRGNAPDSGIRAPRRRQLQH